jgi:hypothetical protein
MLPPFGRELSPMPGRELQRRAATRAVSTRAVKAMHQIATEAQLEQGTIKAISAVSEYAISEVEYLKRVQNQVEQANPDAADAVAAIVNITVVGIARRVGRFTSEVDW